MFKLVLKLEAHITAFFGGACSGRNSASTVTRQQQNRLPSVI